MPDVDAVIKALECAIDEDHFGFKNCHSCHYRKDIDHLQYVCDGDKCMADAIELLKKLKPKPKESRAMLPCVCGSKRRSRWYGHGMVFIACARDGCKVSAPGGKTEIEAIRNWNKMIREMEGC